MLGAYGLESSFAEKHLGVLVDNKLVMSHQYTLAAKKANSILDIANRLKEVILAVYYH